MAVDDVYRVVISATGTGSTYQNTYSVRMKTEPAPTEALFNAFATQWANTFRSQQTSVTTYVAWEATQLWGNGMTINAPECTRIGGLAFAGALSGLPGQLASDGLPPQNALVITFSTGYAGRRKRGRIYVFAQGEANQVDGLWTNPHMLTYSTNMDLTMAKYKHPSGTDPNFTLGIWSERTASGCVPAIPPAKGHVPVDPPHPEMAFTPVTAYTLRPTVYSQRRRTRGVGR